MFNLFKSNRSVIEKIHNEFNEAGDRLLKEAKEIIAGITIENEQKANRLRNFGFSSSAEVEKTRAAQQEKSTKEQFAQAMEYFMVKFPQYKFITTETANAICKKYNLYIGGVRLYKGFVPEKNLKEIEKFFANKNELTQYFYKRSYHNGREVEITQEEYERYEDDKKKEELLFSSLPYEVRAQANYRHEYVGCGQRDLMIAAPIKDMNMTGHEVKGRMILKKEIPDPVVLAPISKNGHQFYCIVTAWGDEASDELVVNQTHN